MPAFRFVLCLAFLGLLTGSLPADSTPVASAPAVSPASSAPAEPAVSPARPLPPEDELLGAVPEPATWVAGSMALALTVFLFLRNAKRWDQQRVAGNGR